MRRAKKIIGLILTFAFAITLANIKPLEVKAYDYRIKICLGNNSDAYFDSEGVASVKSAYPDRVIFDKADELEIVGFSYNEEVNIDVDELIKINPDEEGNSKYYVSGLRISGGDTIVTTATKDSDDNRQVSLVQPVTGDETYVVAYGVGSTIPYTVQYVDESGNALLPEDTLYAARGEVILVPAKHIEGYYPDALYRTASNGLLDDTVFTFVYSKYSANVVTVVNTTYSSSTEYGEPTYEYQYTTRGSSGQEGTVDNRQTAGGGNANAGGDDEVADSTADDSTTITDEETPLDVIDIDDEETAKSGGTEHERLVRNMILGIIMAVIAAVTVFVALLIAERKKRRQLAKVDSSKNYPKE